MRYHYTLIRIAKIKKMTNPRVEEVMELLELSYISGKSQVGTTTSENCLAVSTKTKHRPINDPASLALDLLPKRNECLSPPMICTGIIHNLTLETTQISTNRINIMCYIQTVDSQTSLKNPLTHKDEPHRCYAEQKSSDRCQMSSAHETLIQWDRSQSSGCVQCVCVCDIDWNEHHAIFWDGDLGGGYRVHIDVKIHLTIYIKITILYALHCICYTTVLFCFFKFENKSTQILRLRLNFHKLNSPCLFSSLSP